MAGIRSRGADDSQALGARHGLRAPFDAKLYENVLHMRFHCFRSNRKGSADFLVGKT